MSRYTKNFVKCKPKIYLLNYLSQCTTNDYTDRELSILYNIMVMQKNNTTISRKIQRNSLDCWWGMPKYKPLEAEKKYVWRRQKANRNHV